jgi:ketosteroid isomerase-like protein
MEVSERDRGSDVESNHLELRRHLNHGESRTTRSWFEDYLAAWNSLDVDQVLAWMTHDIVYEDTTLGHTASGTQQMKRFAEASFRRVPDARFEFLSGHDDGMSFSMEWIMHPMGVHGASVGSLRDGRVRAHRDYWNGAAFQPATG